MPDDEFAGIIVHTFDRFLYVLTDSRNGFFQLERIGAGKDFMVHVAALPGCRGWEMMDGAREVVELMRVGGCSRLWTWTRADNRRARMFASMCGMRQCGAPDNWRSEYYSEDDGVWMALEVKVCQAA